MRLRPAAPLVALLAFALCMLFVASPVAAQPSTPAGQRFQATGSGHAIPRRVSTTTVPQTHNNGRGIVRSPLPAPASAIRGPHIPAAHQGAVAVRPPLNATGVTVHASFAGQGNTGWTPSDANAVAGPSNVVETVNEQWAIYGRTGGQQYVTTFNSWFGQSGSLFDPKVVYDVWGGRFIMLVDTGSSVLVSVSDQSSAFGGWCNYTFPTIAGFADYPQLGVDYNGVYFGVNMYNSSNWHELFSANRTQMEACQTVNYLYWSNLRNPDNSTAFTIVPAVAYSYGGSTEYLVESYAGGGCKLTFWRLTGSSLASSDIGTLCYSPPSPAAQKGSAGTIETLDNRLYRASYLNGRVDVALTGAYNWGNGNNNSVVWWFKINASNASLYQQGGFGYAGYWYFFPGFTEDSNGNAIVVYNASGLSTYVNIWYVAMNTGGGIVSNNALVWGNSYYGTSGTARWGDYQSAWLDPTSYTQVWICGQYAAATNSWGTWLGDVSY